MKSAKSKAKALSLGDAFFLLGTFGLAIGSYIVLMTYKII
jgi:hypothetical protein